MKNRVQSRLRALAWLPLVAVGASATLDVACTQTVSNGDVSELEAGADATAGEKDGAADAAADAADATADAPEDAMPEGQAGMIDAPADAGPDAKDAASDGGIVGPLEPVLFGMSSSNAAVLREDGTVVAWGGFAAVGDDALVNATSPVTVPGLTNPVSIGTGANARHQCVVMADTTVECWGANEAGQLGDGTTVNRSTPVVVITPPLAPAPPPSDAGADSGAGDTCTHSPCSIGASLVTGCDPCATSVCSGDSFCCTNSWDTGCLNEAKTQCTMCGAPGDGGIVNCHSPCTGGANLPSSCGTCATTLCALDSYCCLDQWDGTCVSEAKVFCPADTCAGPDGGGAEVGTDGGVVVRGPLTGVLAVTLGSDFTCALLSSGMVTCWGGNEAGQLGIGTSTPSRTPVGTVPGLSNVTAIAAGDGDVCARLADGTVRCWGFAQDGALGGGDCASNQLSPQPVSGLTDAVAICNAGSHACAVHASGVVTCWGSDGQGQIGDGSSSPAVCTPKDITTFGGAVDVACSSDASCALTADGHVWCWGSDLNAEMANTTTSSIVFAPAQVARVENAIGVRMGAYTVCALTRNVDDAGAPDASEGANSLRCWGYNGDGEVGVGSTDAYVTKPGVVP